MIVELNRAFKNIVYYDDGHYYVNTDTGEQLTSVTTYKKKFMHPFDGSQHAYWLNKKALEAGLTDDEMQDVWDEMRIVGTLRGSIIHDWAECLTHRKVMPLELNMTHMAKMKRQVLNYMRDYPNYINVATELVIGNDFLGGQIDRLVWDEKLDGLRICDYKTDKKTEEKLRKSYKKLKKPLNNYAECDLSGYWVQVNLYREILEEKGFDVKAMEIAHFCANHDDYKVYEVPKIDILNA